MKELEIVTNLTLLHSEKELTDNTVLLILKILNSLPLGIYLHIFFVSSLSVLLPRNQTVASQFFKGR